MFEVIYSFAILLVTWLKMVNLISWNFTIIIVLITGLILLLLDINRVHKLKQKAGEELIQLENELIISKVAQSFSLITGIILIFIFFYGILSPKIREEWFLYNFIGVYVIVYDLYLGLFVRGVFVNKGFFTRGKLIEWTNFISYEWRVPRLSFLKGYSKLVIKKENALWIDSLRLTIKDSQKSEMDELLKRKIGKSVDIE